LPKPYRSYRSGWVFRNEKPGPGRFRQFMQFDADTVGTPTVAADAEMCMMMADVMEALGIPRGDYVIRVNNRKVLDGVLEAIGLGGQENVGRRLTVLRAIDKLDKFGPEGVKLLLGKGRWDGGKEGEGDFTKGAGLDEAQVARLEETVLFFSTGARFTSSETVALADDVILDGKSHDDPEAMRLNNRDLAQMIANRGADNEIGRQAANELQELAAYFDAAGYGTKRILIDPSV